MKKSRLLLIVLAAALITMACTCPITGWIEKFTNPSPEQLLDLVPDELLDELPEDIGETVEEIATAMPDVIEEGMDLIPEAANEVDMENLMDEGVPENIPMVEDYDDLLAFAGVVNYSTTTEMEAMKEFYLMQMPAYGWTEDESNGTTDLGPYAVAMEFFNDNETATITIVESDGQTLVTIIVAGK